MLHETGGNKKLAARKLGIHRSTLYAKLRRYGLMDAEGDSGADDGSRRDSGPLSGAATAGGSR